MMDHILDQNRLHFMLTRKVVTSVAYWTGLLMLSLVLSATAVAQNILFYGNSFTLGSGSTDSVFNLVQDIATAAGYPTPNVESAAVGGKNFTWHLANNTDPIFSRLPSGQHWDYAVMQNFSTAPTSIGNLSRHRSDSVDLYQAIASHSPDVTPVLFETWARAPGHSFYSGPSPRFPGGPTQMQAELREGYRLAAQDIDAAASSSITRIAEVGDRWEDTNWNNLHANDLYHAGNRGTLLASLEIFSQIYQQPTSGIDLSGILRSLRLPSSDGEYLTDIVDNGIRAPTSAQTIYFDFGNSGDPDFDVGTNRFKNIVGEATQNVLDAVDSEGNKTGISLSIDEDSSLGFNQSTNNGSGVNPPEAPAADIFDPNSTRDSLFGHADSAFSQLPARDKVVYDITGLEPDTAYDFTFFASRLGVDDIRDATYTVNGSAVTLDAANNMSETAQLLGVMSNGLGEATLTIAEGPNNTNSRGFFYLGAMQIKTVPEPVSGILLLLGLIGCITGRRVGRGCLLQE